MLLPAPGWPENRVSVPSKSLASVPLTPHLMVASFGSSKLELGNPMPLVATRALATWRAPALASVWK